jgi:hypothetical protein
MWMVPFAQLAQVLRLRFPCAAGGQSLGIVCMDALEQFDRYTTRLAALWVIKSAAINIPSTV